MGQQITNVDGDAFIVALKECAERYNFNYRAVRKCSDNAHGNALQHAAAMKTPKDLQYVPWLVVNGSHPAADDENAMLDDIFSWACKNYTGSNKPVACPHKLSIKSKLCMNKSVESQIASLSSQITA